MNILIVDDEPLARKRTHKLLNDIENCYVVGEAESGNEALEQCERLQPDLVLLDIRMPGIDGLETAQHLNMSKNPPAIIFCTAYEDHALEAFDAKAIDYLLKPIRRERLADALLKAKRYSGPELQLTQEALASKRTHICARIRGNLILVAISDIICFIADHKYITIRYDKGEILIEDSLKSLESEFNPQFIRIHRNALVARDRILGLSKNSEGQSFINLNNIDEPLEISRRNLPFVRKLLKEL